jgi:hypothetical protein
MHSLAPPIGTGGFSDLIFQCSTLECSRLFTGMEGTVRLVAEVMYGSGLRLMEALRLRVKDLDFERRQITVRAVKVPVESPASRQDLDESQETSFQDDFDQRPPPQWEESQWDQRPKCRCDRPADASRPRYRPTPSRRQGRATEGPNASLLERYSAGTMGNRNESRGWHRSHPARRRTRILR